MFPDIGEQLIVRKRQGEGANAKVEYVGIFRMQDLQGCHSVEAFLSRHVVPKFGYGAYPVALLDVKGQETKHDEFSIAGPAPVGARNGDPSSVVAELLREVILKRQEGVPDSAGLGGLGALGHPHGAQPCSHGAPYGAPMPAPSDPVKDDLLRKMIDKVERLEHAVSQPKQLDPVELVERVAARMQPAPAQHIDWLQLAALVKDTMRELRPPEPKEDSLDKFLKYQQLIGSGKSVETELLKEMLRDQKDRANRLEEKIEKITDMPPEDPIDKLKSMVDAVKVVKELAGETEKKDTLAAYLSDMFKHAPAVFDKVGHLMDKAMARDKQTIQGKLLLTGKTKLTQAAVQKAKEVKETNKPETEPYPEGFNVYISRLVAAKETGDKVRATLEAFQFLGQHEPWKKYFDACVLLAKAKDSRAIEYVEAFLDVLYDRRDIPEVVKLDIVAIFKTHWSQIIDVVLAAGAGADAPADAPQAAN